MRGGKRTRHILQKEVAKKKPWGQHDSATLPCGSMISFSQGRALRLMPSAEIRSVGYYGLMKIPIFGKRIQDLMAALFGNIAGRLGYGHMLIAVEKKRG